MNQTNSTRMLAIALDAAEPQLVRRLIEEGRMPSLARLQSEGRWLSVESNAWLGSGAVWPTFITGDDPAKHGVYGEWLWHPETMEISRYRGNDLTPFWKQLRERGVSVGILDVPFMPLIGLSDGFEISEWGPHDVLEGRTQAGPQDVAERIENNEIPRHPLASGTPVSSRDDHQNIQKLGAACLDGVKLRGPVFRNLLAAEQTQFSIVAFPEVHRSSHYLWHTAEPDHEVYRSNGFFGSREVQTRLEDIYHEVDRQIGEMVAAVDEETVVMVFSLHGMRPTHGTPSFLTPFLCELGYARLGSWNSQGWRDRSKALMASVKRNLPEPLKKLYYKLAPTTTTRRVAQSTMLPLYDWRNTQAFSLPTDQNGWIRINLVGREAQGIVPTDRYESLCLELESKLTNLITEDGRPLVQKVIRTSDRVEEAMERRIPDLVIHWDEAGLGSPVRIKGSAVKVELIGQKYAGQHGYEGFCILKGAHEIQLGNSLLAKDMGGLITNILTNTSRPQEKAAAG